MKLRWEVDHVGGYLWPEWGRGERSGSEGNQSRKKPLNPHQIFPSVGNNLRWMQIEALDLSFSMKLGRTL